MKDFSGMSEEEVQRWAEDQRRRSAARYAPPDKPLSRVKMNNYADQQPRTWDFHLEPGSRAELNRFGETTEGVVAGLRRVADGGPLALLVREDDRLVALRRQHGDTWGDDPGARSCEVTVLSPQVVGWPVAADSDVLPEPDDLEELRVRTNNFADQP